MSEFQVHPTYIENFDKEIGGGIPKGHVVLLQGQPGTMKSTLTYHILYNNILKGGAKGVYITLEESGGQLIASMKRLGYTEDLGDLLIGDISKLREDKKEDESSTDWMELLTKHLESFTSGPGDHIVVIDSLPALYSLQSTKKTRASIFHFIRLLKSLPTTSILISEKSDMGDGAFKMDIGFLVDGIIELRLVEMEELGLKLRILCTKMRQQRIGRNFFELDYKDNRFISVRVIPRSSN